MITGDKDLLVLEESFIMTPNKYMEEWERLKELERQSAFSRQQELDNEMEFEMY